MNFSFLPFNFILIFLIFQHSGTLGQCPNLVKNGDFENGNQFFFSDYFFYSSHSFLPASSYGIENNANNLHILFSPCQNTGNYLIANGATQPDFIIWSQTIKVQPNTNYFLLAEVASVYPDSPAALQFSINGHSIGSPFSPSQSTCIWDQFSSKWKSGADTLAKISIINKNLVQGGNDFGIDNIKFFREDDLEIVFPNVFTPGIDGFNDFFRWEFAGESGDNFEIKIFNRWGELVFQTEQPDHFWNGNFLSGSPVPDGVYFYAASVNSNCGDIKIRKNGTITLLRE